MFSAPSETAGRLQSDRTLFRRRLLALLELLFYQLPELHAWNLTLQVLIRHVFIPSSLGSSHGRRSQVPFTRHAGSGLLLVELKVAKVNPEG